MTCSHFPNQVQHCELGFAVDAENYHTAEYQVHILMVAQEPGPAIESEEDKTQLYSSDETLRIPNRTSEVRVVSCETSQLPYCTHTSNLCDHTQQQYRLFTIICTKVPGANPGWFIKSHSSSVWW